MTRKRFIKLLMAKGWSRNEANQLARFIMKTEKPMRRESKHQKQKSKQSVQ